MARRGTFIALLFIIISAFFVQCNDKSGTDSRNINKDTLTYVWVNYSNPDSLNTIITYNFKAPLFTKPKEASIRLNKLIFNIEDSNLTLKKAKVLLKNKLKKYLKEPYDFHKEYPKTPLLPYIKTTKYIIYVNRANLFSFSIILYNYSGGAHGNELIKYHNYNTANNTFMRINNLFTNLDSARTLLLSTLKRDYKIPSNSNLISNNFSISDSSFFISPNFLITDSTIIFTYQSYEIAPYSMGPISIRISNKTIRPLLRREASDIINNK